MRFTAMQTSCVCFACLVQLSSAVHLRSGMQGLAAKTRTNESEAIATDGKWIASSYGSSDSCHDTCATKRMICDLANSEMESKKDIKKAAEKTGLECDGVKTGDFAAAGYLVLADAEAKKGKCYRVENVKAMDCSVPTQAGTRRLCYCVDPPPEAAADTYEPTIEATSSYWPTWHNEWVWPATINNDWKLEICKCYAKKGEHGADAVPDTLIHPDSLEEDGDHCACSEYCKSAPGGPFHAADLHLLTDWSTRRPAVVVVHGKGGSKDQDTIFKVSSMLRDAGFIVLTVMYQDDTCTEDVGNAVEFLKTHADAYGILADSIAIYGWSLGGQCAIRAGFKNAHMPNQNVKAVIDMSGCGGKGPFNDVKQLTEATPPPSLIVLHAEDDKEILIPDCYEMVGHARSKTWKNNGVKTELIIKEKYFTEGGHNLVKNSKTSEEAIDAFIDWLFQYLGRPCRTNDTDGYLDNMIVDRAWPDCKPSTTQVATDKCGGVYEDMFLLGPTCDYP